jgi:CubicO group peptidase (beta-lactamase class C family)
MKKLILLVWIVILTVNSKAQIPVALANQLQNILNNAVSTGSNNGVSAYLKLKNGTTWSGVAGINGQSLPITDSTVFHGASTTKLNIAVLMLLLAQNNIVNLDSSWYKYVKTLSVSFDKAITIRQLLNHTSGIKDYLEVPGNSTYITSNFSAFYTPKYILENIVNGVPDFPRGTNFNYSTSNFVLAALVAEAATGNPVQTELRNRIWNPLKMKHTYFGAYDSIPDRRAGVWWNFGSGLANYSSQPTTSMLSFGYGGANIVTTPKDLTILVDTLMSGQLLSAQSMTDMLTFVPQSYGGWWTAGYGLGVHHLLGQKVDTLIGHDGDYTNLTDVFHSSMCGVTLVTMTNTETLWQGLYNSMYNTIRTYYNCNMVPVANFYSTPNSTCPGNVITFKDSSSNVRPSSWKWNFPGGILTGSTTVTDSMPQVIYNVPGTYPVSYTATAAGGSNSITKSSYITIYSNIASYNTNFLESFETLPIPNSDWSLVSGPGTNWATTSLGAATGTNSAYIDNFTNVAGNKSSLISTSFDISGFTNPKFSFKVAYQQKAASNIDKLQILTSTNCGSTWTIRLTKLGSSLVTVSPPSTVALSPTPSQFTTYTVNIFGVTGSNNVRFRFDFYADAAGAGNNVFIDDINLYDGALGIETNEQLSGLNVYPNPAGDLFYVDANTTEKLELDLFDVNGRHVLSAKAESGSGINVSTLSEGIYSVRIKATAGAVNKKLVIIR